MSDQATGRSFTGHDLYNHAAVDTQAGMRYLIAYLYAVGTTAADQPRDPDDDSMGLLPEWLQRTARRYAEELLLQLDLLEEAFTEPTDASFYVGCLAP
ncbi:hypothetical protein [Myceligenerans indicum]|uniref:Uncharacterized protein n=1 Tax=Myceligenerans indicum TaxID=2593663 RepID=A0ABS1LR67_9MICO|nr:hypothetical protein [Myceligenerans indicum]MBL0888791.1 hypothetical protein [Myceligenerans indicum]